MESIRPLEASTTTTSVTRSLTWAARDSRVSLREGSSFEITTTETFIAPPPGPQAPGTASRDEGPRKRTTGRGVSPPACGEGVAAARHLQGAVQGPGPARPRLSGQPAGRHPGGFPSDP